MANRLAVFISSTVRDFEPVRRDIAAWLRSRSIEVRLSEDPEFPVRPSVHSFAACLDAIEGCSLMVLLVGRRYGSCHLDSNQSITWREYDEAVRLRIPVVKLVLREVNDEAVRAARANKPSRKVTVIDDIDVRVFAFIDAIRRGARDNWAHLDWDGSFASARQRIDSRVNSLFVSYQDRHRRLVAEAEGTLRYAAARRLIDSFLVTAQAILRAESGRTLEMVEAFLRLLVSNRATLFGFREDDLYNFAVYARRGGALHVVAREAHPKIRRRDRTWKVGEGHVGLAAHTSKTHVSPNLRHSAGWIDSRASDARTYVSAISVPAGDPNHSNSVAGVFIVTSNRPDQFPKEETEVLTAESIALMLGSLGAFGSSAP
jgi:hypothetical protein